MHGALFNVFSQISHVNEDCIQGVEDFKEKTGTKRVEWVTHELLSCFDYNCDSRLWGFLSMNLNNQGVHHVFPGVHPCHYIELCNIILPIAEKHGIDYERRTSASFLQVVGLYLGWLKHLNEDTSTARKNILVSLVFYVILMLVLFILPFVLFF